MTDLELSEKLQKAIEHLKGELSLLRTGRASVSLVENLKIPAYGSTMLLKELANLTAPEPQLIIIQPWDKSVVQDTIRGINQSNLGINPISDGDVIRLPFPSLSEERRLEMAKKVGGLTEEAKISIRAIRQDAMGAINEMEKNKVISKDDFFRKKEEVEKKVREASELAGRVGEAKRGEVMKI